jgi:hypothetical protein
VPRLPGQAAQGLLGCGCRVQGLGLLPHRQPRFEHVLHAGERRGGDRFGGVVVFGIVVVGHVFRLLFVVLVFGRFVVGFLVDLLLVVRFVRLDVVGGLSDGGQRAAGGGCPG